MPKIALIGEPLIGAELRTALKHAGCDVCGFTDRASALEGLRHTQVDLVILDLEMPGADRDFIRTLRLGSDLLTILLTSMDKKLDEPLTDRSTGYITITKPLTAGLVVERVKGALRARGQVTKYDRGGDARDLISPVSTQSGDRVTRFARSLIRLLPALDPSGGSPLPLVVLNAYVAAKEGSPLSKKAAALIVEADDMKTGRKYGNLAERVGLVRAERAPDDKRKELLFPTERLEDILQRELAAIDAEYSVERIADQQATPILIIEDQMFVALQLKRLVEKLGHHVIGVVKSRAEVNQTIKRIREKELPEPGLVLADILLPDGSGIDAVNDLYSYNEVPVIFVTGNATALSDVPGWSAAKVFEKRGNMAMLQLEISNTLRDPSPALRH